MGQDRVGDPRGGQDKLRDLWGGQDRVGCPGEARMGWGTHGEARTGWGNHRGARMMGPRPVHTGVLVCGTPSCTNWEVCSHTVLFIDDQRVLLFLSEDPTIVPVGSKPPSLRRSLGPAS